MRAVMLTAPGRPLEDVEVPDPAPAESEVLVRVEASGICHSDAHYRAGFPATRVVPIILGHEIAGVVESVGPGVDPGRVGERIAVHYVVSDTTCRRCREHGEQFCEQYEMFGLTTDGGYAERIAVPARNAISVPDRIPTEHAAVMMCSSATSLHALHKARMSRGESVAVVGVGGLGMSAVQLARAMGARQVFAVDIDLARLELAGKLGAIPVEAGPEGPQAIQDLGGADVALVLVDRPEAYTAAMAALRPRGRLVAIGIAGGAVPVVPYRDLIGGEHELIGSNDHLLEEVHELFRLAEASDLVLDEVVAEQIPLGAEPVNRALDRLDAFGGGVRTDITP